MGADLCVYILVGPNELSDDAVNNALSTYKLRAEAVNAAQTRVNNSESVLDEHIDMIGKAFAGVKSGKDAKAFSTLMIGDDPGDLITYQLSELVCCDIIKSNPDVDPVETIRWWDQARARDAASRPFGKDRKIVVAGERTWGDSPEGIGFRWCKFVDEWGLSKILGLE